MDNGNKIKLIHKEVALFLGDDLKNFNERTVKPYDFEAEYAKTKKNHQAPVWIFLVSCFICVGIGTMIAVKSVSNSNEKISVNIDTFNDLNLKELLSMAGSSQNLYEDAVRTKESLEAELQNELDSAERKKENDIFTLKSISFYTKKSERAGRQKKIEDEYNAALKAAHQKYDSKIEQAEEDIKKYELQISGYDQTMLQQARQAESSIDSQKQLNDMKFKMQNEKSQKQIKDLRKQLADEKVRAKEEMQKAVDEVQRTYQAQIVLLMKSHKAFLEELVAHNGGDGLVTDSSNIDKIQIYLSDVKVKRYLENPAVKCLVGSNTALFSIKKEGEKYYAVSPEEPPAAVPASSQAVQVVPAPVEVKPVSAFAGDKVEFVVPALPAR